MGPTCGITVMVIILSFPRGWGTGGGLLGYGSSYPTNQAVEELKLDIVPVKETTETGDWSL